MLKYNEPLYKNLTFKSLKNSWCLNPRSSVYISMITYIINSYNNIVHVKTWGIVSGNLHLLTVPGYQYLFTWQIMVRHEGTGGESLPNERYRTTFCQLSSKVQSWTNSQDTFAFVGLSFNFTCPTSPPPHKQRWMRISRIFPEFQLCTGWGKGGLQDIFRKLAWYLLLLLLLKHPKIVEIQDYCITIPRTFI